MHTRIKAFKHALRGACTLISTQPHARFHAIATTFVILPGTVVRLSPHQWALIVLAMAGVWVAEAFNTAIEFLADEVCLEWRERIKHAKDLAAFGVLVAALAAALVGTFVFLPYFVSA